MKVLLFLSLLYLPNAFSQVSIKAIGKEFVNKIITTDGNNYCSSTFVEYKGKIRHITNAHCCVGKLSFNNSPATIKKVNILTDLCEITHNKIPVFGAKIINKDLEPGDKVYSIGFPSTYQNFSISEGYVVTEPVIDNFKTIIYTNAWSYFGYSGGATFNAEGEVVGINSVMMREHQHGGYIPVAILKEFLN